MLSDLKGMNATVFLRESSALLVVLKKICVIPRIAIFSFFLFRLFAPSWKWCSVIAWLHPVCLDICVTFLYWRRSPASWITTSWSSSWTRRFSSQSLSWQCGFNSEKFDSRQPNEWVYEWRALLHCVIAFHQQTNNSSLNCAKKLPCN